MKFALKSKFKPTGDQPQAIKKLVAGLAKKQRSQVLLGVTGSGKTFTMANVINQVQRPTLIISHNKTLAAQLASEFHDFFPQNAVHYFVSYYDYYQPESYIARTDTYIEKTTKINEEIDRLRNAATSSLLSRQDVIVVASVSCIYGIGSPTVYDKVKIKLAQGAKIDRTKLLKHLIKIRYERNDFDFKRGSFRIKGDLLEIYPSYWTEQIVRIEFFGDKIEKIMVVDYLNQVVLEEVKDIAIFPATHYVAPDERVDLALLEIDRDLKVRVKELKDQNKLLEAQRLTQRTKYDLEMMRNTGFCKSIENYSRYFDGRKPGQPAYSLMDYFPKDDYLLFVDESHMTIPQINGMYLGDQARKQSLIDYGFRLPSALDNRPLKFEEFDQRINQIVYVSATPREYELKQSQQVAEQLIRPTGLLDSTVEVRPTEGQIDDLLLEIKKRVKKKQRVLITTLTKRMSEDLADHLRELDVKVQYLHSEIDTMERLEILRDLRLGEYDVLVGINLLREGLDLPEVSLIVILDADKESYLRSDIALIQTMGRAARHIDGHIIMYADNVSGSMKRAISETERRRKIQRKYNLQHKITPKSIIKAIRGDRLAGTKKKETAVPTINLKKIPKEAVGQLIKDLSDQMELAAKNLEFETAARLRDQIKQLRQAQPKKKKSVSS
ncbi:excinuclease ABC subunit UvrB [Patescibacteria group bacterium]|nr:excinuclease ABC subunit UvrB [Patescibacteria group bacterium]